MARTSRNFNARRRKKSKRLQGEQQKLQSHTPKKNHMLAEEVGGDAEVYFKNYVQQLNLKNRNGSCPISEEVRSTFEWIKILKR